ncbi:sulfatase [Arthrobacter pigmenti]
MTGRWPHRNGAEGFGPVRDDVPVLTELLKLHGYSTGILGKVGHLQPVERFNWTFRRDMAELGMGRNAQRYKDAALTFFREAATAGRPWFLMANAHDPHRPFHGSEQEREEFSAPAREEIPAPSREFVPEDGVAPPGFLPDLEATRLEYAEYLSSSRRCDDVIKNVLAALDESRSAENTLVVFISDNGMSFPFAKANCYLRSTLTPLIVRWPGVVRPGSVQKNAFASMLDLFPTFCDAAGVCAPSGIDGRSLLPVLMGRSPAHRSEVFTVFHETAAKRRYEMRCTQDTNYGYIWNAWSDGDEQYQAENMNGRSWAAIGRAAEINPWIKRRASFFLNRDRDELYDLRVEPDALHNLSGEPAYSDILARLQARLAEWMHSTNDPLAPTFLAELERVHPYDRE